MRTIFDDFWRFYRIFHLMYIIFGIGPNVLKIASLGLYLFNSFFQNIRFQWQKLCTWGEKFDKIVKNCQKLPSNRQKWTFSKKIFFCSFYVIMGLHAKNCVCRSNGVTCGQYKDTEEKTPMCWFLTVFTISGLGNVKILKKFLDKLWGKFVLIWS